MSKQHNAFEMGSYSDVFSLHNRGTGIWNWLWEPETIGRMEAACDLNKPAVEPLQHGLSKRFGARLQASSDKEFNRIKMMIGQMVKQVLLSRGFELKGKNYRVSSGKIFSTGAKYRRS